MKNYNEIRIENMIGHSGNKIANQFLVHTPNEGVYFKSYNSIIAFKPYGTGQIILDEKYWDFSTTTSKYRNLFLMEDKKTTAKKIKSGEYKLENLNK